jgi:hypothetical protein
MVFISLTSFRAFRWPSSHVTWPGGKKFPPKKYRCREFFTAMRSQRYGHGLRYSRGRSTGRPISTGHCAPAEYFKNYEKRLGFEPEKQLMLAVLEDAIGCFQKFVCPERTTGRRNGFWKRRNGLTRRKARTSAFHGGKLQQALTARPTAHGIQPSTIYRQNSIGDIT